MLGMVSTDGEAVRGEEAKQRENEPEAHTYKQGFILRAHSKDKSDIQIEFANEYV